MSLPTRSGQRFENNVWAGFVDATTALLLVMVFILSIFMIIQFFMRETIRGQGQQLANLSGQLDNLSETLSSTEQEKAEIESEKEIVESELGNLSQQLEDLSAVLSSTQAGKDELQGALEGVQGELANLQLAKEKLERDKIALQAAQAALKSEKDILANAKAAAEGEIGTKTEEIVGLEGKLVSIEEQVASLIARNTELDALLAQSQSAREEAMSREEAARLALASARSEIDKEAEAARLAAARADALEELIAEFRQNTGDEGELRASIAQVLALVNQARANEEFASSDLGRELNAQVAALTQLEREQLADQAATQYLRERLKTSEEEISAMALALEEERKEAEETLTLLAALRAREEEIENRPISEEEKTRALLALAREEIAARKTENERIAKRIALLNQQSAALRAQLAALQGLLNQAAEADKADDVQITSLGASINSALARIAAEEKKRAQDLETYKSEFFGRLRQLLEDVEGIEIVGDRFVLSTEVLFPSGSAQLSTAGQSQIYSIARLLIDVSQNIPPEINWILRVDGHTDATPILANSRFQDNWQLSQARAMSVVRYMVELGGIDPTRLAAAGFGEFHPIDNGSSPEALARNRRIELKLTEK